MHRSHSNYQVKVFYICLSGYDYDWDTNKKKIYNKNPLIVRLRRKEEAINDWELHQTMKAMDQMDKIQACNLSFTCIIDTKMKLILSIFFNLFWTDGFVNTWQDFSFS
jgi:hypothetical protein